MAAVEEAEQKRLDLVRNERLKLTAVYLNGQAIATLAVGGIGPLVASFVSGSTSPLSVFNGVVVICTFTSAALHLGAWRVLGGLRA